MADNFVKEYVELSRDIESKRKVFKKSIASLEQEIADRTQAFNDSIQDLTIKEKEYVDKIKEEGEDILWKIGKILKNKVNWYDINKYLKEFGIITEPYEDSTEDESYLNYNCLLRNIEEITDTHIKFSAEQFFGDELEYGYVSIPRKYFGTNLLDDEDYLSKIFANIEIQVDYFTVFGETVQFDELYRLEIDLDKKARDYEKLKMLYPDERQPLIITIEEIYEGMQSGRWRGRHPKLPEVKGYNSYLSPETITKTRGIFFPKAMIFLADELNELMNAEKEKDIEKSKQEEIAELEARLAELKGETV